MLTDANFTSRLLSQELFIIILLILGVYVSLVAFTGIIGMIKEKDNIILCVSWINKAKKKSFENAIYD